MTALSAPKLRISFSNSFIVKFSADVSPSSSTSFFGLGATKIFSTSAYFSSIAIILSANGKIISSKDK
jgi:hypothetical protein